LPPVGDPVRSTLDMDAESDETPRLPMASKIRRGIIALAVLATAAFWIYTRFIMQKSQLGGPCKWAIQCASEVPRCMKESAEAQGACSRPCDINEGDCQVGIRCVEVELEERDDRGMPLKRGYCVPENMLPASKKAALTTARGDSWVDVPEIGGQLEGEITYQQERHGVLVGEKTTWGVKGSLVRTLPETRAPRLIVDTSALRLFTVDDAHQSFFGNALSSKGGNVNTTKSDKKDTVVDRECDIWRVEEDRATREVCVILGAAWVDPAATRVPLWQRELAVRSALPLRIIEQDTTGHEVSRIVATRLFLKPMDRALFSIPKSYRNQALKPDKDAGPPGK
jgi:hypothetical protein